MARTKKPKKAKFKLGQFVYSYQNKTEKRPINRIHLSDDPEYPHRYRLTLTDNEGYPKNSNWINEGSLKLRKIKAKY